jgi:serine protease Do
VEELIANGYVSGRPVVGVSVSALSSMASSFYGLPRGLYVNSISREANAYEIGIRSGDIITELNGAPVTSITEALELRDACAVGQEIKLTIYRNRVYYEATIVLEEQGLLGGDYNF